MDCLCRNNLFLKIRTNCYAQERFSSYRNDLLPIRTICYLEIGTIYYNRNNLLHDRNDFPPDRNNLLPNIIYFWRMRVEQNMAEKKLEYSKATGNEKMQLGMGNILAMIHMLVGIKTLQLIKHLRRNLVPLLHWPYPGQSKTCYPQEIPTIWTEDMHPAYPSFSLASYTKCKCEVVGVKSG